MHLRHIGFMYSTCESFTKNKKRIQKFKETRDTWCIYENELDQVYFQHDTVYDAYEDLPKRRAYYNVLHSKAFLIANNPQYDRYQHVVASVVYKFFDKKSRGNATHAGARNGFKDQQLTNKLQWIIKIFRVLNLQTRS